MPAAAAAAAPRPPVVPPKVPELPVGPQTRCTTTGPPWTLDGVHGFNGSARHGNRYLLTAWGLRCGKVRGFLAAMFPVMAPHTPGALRRAPQGYACRGTASGSPKNRAYSGTCIRKQHPPATFSWEPTGGSVDEKRPARVARADDLRPAWRLSYAPAGWKSSIGLPAGSSSRI